MHDERVNIIVSNAFNGLGDATGSDEFGYSVAWIDLNDYVEAEGWGDSDALGDYLKSWQDVAGRRYALAYLDAAGTRSAVGYSTRDDMMHAYRAIEAEYLDFEDNADA